MGNAQSVNTERTSLTPHIPLAKGPVGTVYRTLAPSPQAPSKYEVLPAAGPLKGAPVMYARSSKPGVVCFVKNSSKRLGAFPESTKAEPPQDATDTPAGSPPRVIQTGEIADNKDVPSGAKDAEAVDDQSPRTIPAEN